MTVDSVIENEFLHVVISLCILLFAAKIFVETGHTNALPRWISMGE
jgi:hypothetical protein